MIIKIRLSNQKYLITINQLQSVGDVLQKIKQVLELNPNIKLRIMYKQFRLDEKTSAKVFNTNSTYDCHFYQPQTQKDASKSERTIQQIKRNVKKPQTKTSKIENYKKLSSQNEKAEPKHSKQTKSSLKNQNHNKSQSSSESLSQNKEDRVQQIEERQRRAKKYYSTMKQMRERIRCHQKQIKKTSIQDFVGGQVDYYFSNKNYLKDSFIKENLDSSGWMDVEKLLKFPKIHKLQIDTDTLSRYLSYYSPKNYLLDLENRKIKKLQNNY